MHTCVGPKPNEPSDEIDNTATNGPDQSSPFDISKSFERLGRSVKVDRGTSVFCSGILRYLCAANSPDKKNSQ